MGRVRYVRRGIGGFGFLGGGGGRGLVLVGDGGGGGKGLLSELVWRDANINGEMLMFNRGVAKTGFHGSLWIDVPSKTGSPAYSAAQSGC